MKNKKVQIMNKKRDKAALSRSPSRPNSQYVLQQNSGMPANVIDKRVAIVVMLVKHK